MTVRTTTENASLRVVPLSQIEVRPEENVRTGELPKIALLAARLKAFGQHTPLIVTNGGAGAKPYLLRAGNRRFAALKLAGLKEALVVVRSYAGEPEPELAAFGDTWSENEDREKVSPLDKAAAVGRLLDGAWRAPRSDGDVVPKLTQQEVRGLLGLTRDVVRLYAAIHAKLSPEVRDLVRGRDVPVRRLGKWARLDSPAAQLEAAERWIAERRQLAAEGRTKKTPEKGVVSTSSDGMHGDPEPLEKTGAVVSTKRVGKAISGERRTVHEHLRALAHRRSNADDDESRYLQGVEDGLLFMTGERKMLPKVTVADYKATAEGAKS